MSESQNRDVESTEDRPDPELTLEDLDRPIQGDAIEYIEKGLTNEDKEQRDD